MINNDTPYKLREVIMDTWPQLYWLKKEKEKTKKNNNMPHGPLAKYLVK